MNWKQRLFKPKWQHKNADVRLESVTTEQHPEIFNDLLEIAGNDEDSRVRCAAIKRLHQLENILKLHASEKDTDVKALLEERIRQLAASSNESRPPLEFRLQVVETTTDRDLIEHLAIHAPEKELRHAALAKVTRQGVLGDCCIEDSDAGNRRFAASRITQHTTLKRVIDVLRKRDKQLYADLQIRLHKELLEQSDPDAIHTEAVRICSALEKLALNPEAAGKQETKALFAAWQAIANDAGTDMVSRYQRIFERLTAPPVPASAPVETKAIEIKPEVLQAETRVETRAETQAEST